MKRKQDTSFRVETAVELMPFLLSKLGGMTRTSVKQLLSQRRVTVNAGIQTRHDTLLKAGDMVNILQGRGNMELRHPKLRVIYEDDALIVAATIMSAELQISSRFFVLEWQIVTVQFPG